MRHAFVEQDIYMKENDKGFTLSELLVVVAIIAVLVAVSIPIFTSQLHKARVATDWANVRSYYSELTHEYIQTGVFDDSKLREWGDGKDLTVVEISGETVKLKAGYLMIRKNSDGSATTYNFLYMCNNAHDACELVLG